MKYDLKYPIDRLEGGTITQVNIRERFKVADLLELDEPDLSDLESSIRLITRMCKLSRTEVEAMDVDDMTEISQKLSASKNLPTQAGGE